MKNPLISVIIPIYNVSQYLNRCLKSVADQTYKNLEIILVNDGSTDNSMGIIKKWARKDCRIKVINQKNKGLSGARNTGIKFAKGDYLTFIDADDYVTNDYVSYLYGLLKQNNFKSNLAICSLIKVFADSNKTQNMGNGKITTLSGKNCLEKMCYDDLVDTCAYAKLGKRTLYDENFFPEGKLFEDIGSTYKLFEKCNTVECGFEGKYYYVIRNNSIVTSKFTMKKLDLLEMTDQMAHDVTKRYPDLESATKRRQVYARFSTLNQTLSEKNVEDVQKKLIEYIKENMKELINNPLLPRRDRMAYFLLEFGLPIYSFAWKQYLKVTK